MASQSQVDDFLEKERLGELTAAQELAVANQRAKGNFPPPLEQIDTLEGTGRAVVQGGFFGGGDEVVAGGVALKNELLQLAPETFQGIGDYLGLPGSFSSVDRPMGEVYDASLGSERSDLGQFREEQPVIAYGSEILGSIPTAVVGGGALLRGGAAAARAAGVTRNATQTANLGRSLAQKMLAGSGAGAVEGSVYGFNAGEGGAGPRFEDALEGALIGAVGGAAIPAAALGAKKIVNYVRDVVASRPTYRAGMDAPAANIVANAMDVDGAINGAGQARMQAPDAMLADAGEASTSLLDTAIQSGGRAAVTARSRIAGRMENAGAALNKTLDDNLGAPIGALTTTTKIRTGSADARRDAYKSAYDQVIDYGSEGGAEILEDISTRATMNDINIANELIRRSKDGGSRIVAEMGEDGVLTFAEPPTVQQLDYITRALADVSSVEHGKGVLGGSTAIGTAVEDLTRSVRQLIKDQVPEYARALETAAATAQQVRAVRLGQDLLKPGMTRDEFAVALENLPSDAAARAEIIDFIKRGLRITIDDTAANVKRTITGGDDTSIREAILVIKNLSSPAAREKLEMLLGEEIADNMFRRIDEAARAFELSGKVATGSQTYGRTQGGKAVDAAIEGGAYAALQRGEPLQAGKRVIQNFTGKTPADDVLAAERLHSEIADILTSPGLDSAAKIAALESLVRAGQSPHLGRLTENLLRGVGMGGNRVVAGQSDTPVIPR